MIGTTVGKYRIVSLLGRGGMGTVYRAVDDVLDREVAIKVLNAEVADANMVERFRTEAVSLAKLNHPGIATIYELFRTEAALLMVMELVRGETLDRISSRLGPMDPGRAASLIESVLEALEYAHRAGIVHADIKPANLMVTEHGGVKIMDFGVARVRGNDHPDGCMMGTPAYMPPEQVLGGEIDGRADLYSVGVVLYRLLTDALPFQADTAADMAQKHLSETPTPLELHRPGLPDWCETILRRALAKSPGDRFQSAEAFQKALTDAVGIRAELSGAWSVPVADREVPMWPQSATVDEGAPMTALDGQGTSPNLGNVSNGESWKKIQRGLTTIVFPRKPRSLAYSMRLPILATTLAVLTIVAARRLPIFPATSTVETPTEDVQYSTADPAAGSSAGLAAGQPTAPAAELVGDKTDSRSAAPVVPARSAEEPSSSPDGNSAGSVSDEITLDPSRATVTAAGKTFAVPLVFEAKALVREGDRRRERDSQMILADGKITIQVNNDHAVLHTVSYDDVRLISYSQGRDPLWRGPTGVIRVARANRGTLGIFRGRRHWVSLRTGDADAEFVVLRFSNDAQATRALAALEERTGREAEVVADFKDAK